MADLELTLACGDYELTRPLTEGQIKADGITFVPDTRYGARERHWAMAKHNAYDVCEFNAPAYFMARDRGFNWTALPIFAHRRFRHGFVFVNPRSGIREPRDLIGKRIGGTNFQPAGNVFMRGVLEEEYGVPHDSVTWFTERGEDIDFDPHPGLNIKRIRDDQTLDQMLFDGELDARLEPEYPAPFLKGDPRCVQLFPDVKSVEIDYFKRTGIFPIMHVTVVRREIVDEHPWVVKSLMDAFEKAKTIAMKRMENPRVNPLAFWAHAWFEQQRLMGPDPWKYGLGPENRKSLEKAIAYTHMQGLISREWAVDELFAPMSPVEYALADRRNSLRALMARENVDRVALIGNGHHMIDLDNPVAHMTGYRSCGPAVLLVESSGRQSLLANWDEEDAVADLGMDRVQLSRDICGDIAGFVGGGHIAVIGLADAPLILARALLAGLGAPATLDRAFRDVTAAKTGRELAAARRATTIAEEGYSYLLENARPGVRECDLAINVNLRMRELGANDSFLMLNSGPRQDAVMPSSERRIEAGDLLLCELSPSVEGQFTQICRTVSIGPAASVVGEKYPLLAAAMHKGIEQVRPGARLGDVCAAIDDHLSEAGYAQYSRPPFIRRRGHGLGSGSTAPGDVSVDNDTRLETGMLFMVHPNQFLPETGYMMCGEPVVVTPTGFEILTTETATLATARG